MKKFISFVMAAAMVASLVPATAFAKGEVSATAKVIDAKDLKKGETEVFNGVEGPEVQLKVTSVDYQASYSELPKLDVTIALDNAEFMKTDDAFLTGLVSLRGDQTLGTGKEGTTNEKDAVYAVAADKAGATGIATAAADGTATKPAGYTSLATIEALYAPAMTKEEKIADYLKKGYAYTGDGSALLNQKTGDRVEVATITDTAAVTWETLTGTGGTYENHTHFVKYTPASSTPTVEGGDIFVEVKKNSVEKDEVTYTFYGFFEKDTVIAVDLKSEMTKTSIGTKATVSVDSKAVTADDLVFATILDKGIKASTKKTVDIAEEEITELYSKGIKIESAVDGSYTDNTLFELKLSSGFEFVKGAAVKVNDRAVDYKVDGNTLTFTAGTADDFDLTGLKIEATSAKSGAVATIKVTAKEPKGNGYYDTIGTASVEVAKVVDYKVVLSVDEDEDMPVIYSGVNVKNDGITDDSDHWSMEVTAKETFPGAWSMRQGFNFKLPEGVFVTDVEITDTENFVQTQSAVKHNVEDKDWYEAFYNAYQNGEYLNFEFDKRVFDDVNTDLEKDPATVTFKLQLVADPTFDGEVTLKFEGSLVDSQEVKIAKFVKPYTVKAEQNDVIIDYRNTEVKTPIVVTEAEAGLWEKGTEFTFTVDRGDLVQFEDDATFEVDKDSEMELKDSTDTKNGSVTFTVKEESDSKPATVTIKDIKLFMQRNIPAGSYDLEISTTMSKNYDKENLFAAEEGTLDKAAMESRPCTGKHNDDKDCIIDDVTDYSNTVKEAFVNVVTSGRDQDNLFTTKVVVPVGEKYLVAGENKVELDVAAYISDAGYTMLPVRAISKALGVNTNNVLWNAEARTVTIMYGQRIITMTVGQKTIYVNGSAIPASAAPEIRDGRTFLPLRDLGTALGVTDVTWDAATKTATLNGGTK